MVISLKFSTALDFEFSSPERVNVEESFSTQINFETEEIYDVKIIIRDSNKEIISEIFNDGWQNPYYYLKEAYPKNTEFKVRSLQLGEHEICARLRQNGKSNFIEKCNEIIIEGNILEVIKEEAEEYEEESEAIVIKEDKQEIQEISDSGKESSIQTIKISDNLPLGKITLNKPENSETFISKEGKKLSWIFYFFTAFCIIIIILIALRKL